MFRHTYVNPLSRKRYGDWTWCFRCECVYRTTEWFANHWFCPHPGCDGTAHDSSRWGHRNEPPCDLHPEYPAVPVEGRRYGWKLPATEKHQPCESCSQAFASAEQLQAHRQRQHYPWGSNPGRGPRYLCNRCADLLDSRDELAVHQYHVHGMTHPR